MLDESVHFLDQIDMGFYQSDTTSLTLFKDTVTAEVKLLFELLSFWVITLHVLH